ncbi:MAG: ABC transporter permease subunit [Chloroflexota bacterium]
MSELVPTTRRKWQALWQNPVTMKELRSRMRGRRAFVVLTAYLAFMSLFLALIYLAFLTTASGPASGNSRDAGKIMFTAVLGMQVFLVIFIAPAFTAGAISGEKERQTYDLLRTTLLSADSFVLGKLVSALSYVVLLILASIPLQSISFLLGGLSLEELLISQALVLMAAVTFALFGLYCSSRMKTTLGAIIAAYGGALFVTIGTPLIALLLTLITGAAFLTSGNFSWLAEAVMTYVGLVLSATNLPATLILSETILQQENTLLFYQMSIRGNQIWMFSPWPLFLIFYALIAWILYVVCVRRVRQIAEN